MKPLYDFTSTSIFNVMVSYIDFNLTTVYVTLWFIFHYDRLMKPVERRKNEKLNLFTVFKGQRELGWLCFASEIVAVSVAWSDD